MHRCNILSFNFAVICMAPDPNATEYQEDRFTFTEIEDTFITVAVAVAALLANIPIVFFINRVGIRSIFTFLGLLSGVATLLIPTAVRSGLPLLLVCRTLQGVAFASMFPAVGTFAARWTYYKQASVQKRTNKMLLFTGLFVSVLVAYVQFAPVITSPVSGALCDSAGWPSVFYFHGSVTIVLFTAYMFFYRNTPRKHPFVGNAESSKIDRGKTVVEKKTLRRVPYLAIPLTPAIWAIWIGSLGNFATVELMFLYNPVYMKKVLKMSTGQIGLAAAVPPLIQFLVKLACDAASDRIKFASELMKFRCFNSFAYLGCAACFIALAVIDAEMPAINLALLLVGAGILGGSTGGFYKAAPALSKQFSHFVTGCFSIVISAAMVAIPFIVDGLAPDGTQDEWHYVFGIVAGILIITNLIFCVVVRGEPCVWTTDEWIREKYGREREVVEIEEDRVEKMDVIEERRIVEKLDEKVEKEIGSDEEKNIGKMAEIREVVEKKKHMVVIVEHTFGVFSRGFLQDRKLTAAYCTAFTIPFTLMNVHFLYRYWTVQALALMLTYTGLRDAKKISANARLLQLKLLIAVTAQTFVPVIFVYIPYFVVLNFPFFGIPSGPMAGLCMLLTACFPAWDAVIIILLMTDYREAVLAMTVRTCLKTSSARIADVASGMTTTRMDVNGEGPSNNDHEAFYNRQ
ncbi:hypothetical protein PRIPAC_79776 [Pristionchus pacificus]|uniref:G protein-coupled receptor n=1 Tax=Pristionchus pacificus TaxID=54126 RepID=A0A2A6CQ21_PRIPA|nr:hypothetical protein PRIPAC_79776 [Pristionchus pacificus]|eukprot:PDM80131.1 G protein-coupled receptor [Pristionchus pacificus]